MLCNIIKRVVQCRIQTNNVGFSGQLLRYSSNSSSVIVPESAEAEVKSSQSLRRPATGGKKAAQRRHAGMTHEQQPVPQFLAKHDVTSKKPRVEKKQPPVINDTELGLEFVRLSLQDSILSTLLTTARSRKRRDKDGQIIIEGRRLIDEALMCGLRMKALIFSQREQLAQLRAAVAKAQVAHNTKVYKVPQHDLKTWSTLTTPPGLLAVFERPSAKGIATDQQQQAALPITVVCDNIREPNNLGSIIRTCAALPCQQVVVTRGCCDPWESKALRGGCGGHFRLPIRDDVDWEQLALTIPPENADDCHVYVAESNFGRLADRKVTPVDYAALERPGAHNVIIIGGESHGVSNEAYKFMNIVGSRGKCVYIPLAAGVDSLNVTSALTLILFELRKKMLSKNELNVEK